MLLFVAGLDFFSYFSLNFHLSVLFLNKYFLSFHFVVVVMTDFCFVLERKNVCLIKTATSEIIGDDNISDSIEYKLDVVCVCSTRHVAVNFFWGWFVFRFKLSLDICSCLAIFLTTWKEVRKIKKIRVKLLFIYLSKLELVKNLSKKKPLHPSHEDFFNISFGLDFSTNG